MKKIIAILMVMISLSVFAEGELTVESYVYYADEYKAMEIWAEYKEAMLGFMPTLVQSSTIDYLTATVELDRNLWDAVDKSLKESMLLAYVIDMEDKTGSTDIRIKVDYTTVLWVYLDTVQTKRVY